MLNECRPQSVPIFPNLVIGGSLHDIGLSALYILLLTIALLIDHADQEVTITRAGPVSKGAAVGGLAMDAPDEDSM
jgi:hypothetical protein